MKFKPINVTVIRGMFSLVLLQFILLMALLLGLSGCATTPVRVEVREVAVPVAVHPLAAAELPKPPKPLPPRPDSLSAAADLLLAQWCSAVAFIVEAVPMLDAGAGQPPRQALSYPECEG